MQIKITEKFFNIEENPLESKFTVVAETEEAALAIKSDLTIENLKSFKYIESDELYSVIENKKYSDKYEIQKVDTCWHATFFLEDVNSLETTVNKTVQSISEVQATIDYLTMVLEVEV